MKKIVILVAFLAGGVSFSSAAFAQAVEKKEERRCIQVLINGRQASADSLSKLPVQNIKQIHYLHGRDAINLLGPAGAGGLLLVKTHKKESLPAPVLLIEGRQASADVLEKGAFSRIDVVRGLQAQNLYGPGAAGGVLLIHSKKNKEFEVEEADAVKEVKRARAGCSEE